MQKDHIDLPMAAPAAGPSTTTDVCATLQTRMGTDWTGHVVNDARKLDGLQTLHSSDSDYESEHTRVKTKLGG